LETFKNTYWYGVSNFWSWVHEAVLILFSMSQCN